MVLNFERRLCALRAPNRKNGNSKLGQDEKDFRIYIEMRAREYCNNPLG